MRNFFPGWIFAGMTMLAASPLLFAQTAPPSGAARAIPDLSGIWDVNIRRFSLETPLQPWAMEKYKANRVGRPDATQFALHATEQFGQDAVDPLTYCFPLGVPRVMIVGPFEIMQQPKQVVLLFEYNHAVRRIYTDGRGHPDGWPFGWMGHSTGKWDGNTLVVDTVGRNDKSWLDDAGTPHSDALHVVERIRRVNQDTLEIEFLFDDPKAFTKPWGATVVYRLLPNAEILDSVPCEDTLEIGKPIERRPRQ